MPELPDLEVIAEFLDERLSGAQIAGIAVPKPIVARDLTGESWETRLVGVGVQGVSRRGKFLLVELGSGDWLVMNTMRSGRLRYWPPGVKPQGRPFVDWYSVPLRRGLSFSTGAVVHYLVPDTMGKFYLATSLAGTPSRFGGGRWHWQRLCR